MRQDEGELRLSATDLANHLACRHLTHLDRRAARGELTPHMRPDPGLELLRVRGGRHEEAYVASLAAQGLQVVRLPEGASAADTLAAMQQGAEVIVQPVLAAGRWHGRADVLRRVDSRSDLGSWSYEAVDTKLARDTRAGTLLQLCLYSELLARTQGSVPRDMHVVPPSAELRPVSYRVHEHQAYFRWIAARLEAELESGLGTGGEAPYPDPVAHCDLCRWWHDCQARWRQDDHLSLVAGISRLQRSELAARGLTTMAALAGARLPLSPRPRPRRGSADGYARVREQARLQVAGRGVEAPPFELLDCEPGQGLGRLPEPARADLFFDFEGDAFAGLHGLEYLFGWVGADGGDPCYERLWALDAAGERAAFEHFIDLLMRRWEADPGFHVYHFGAYEPAHLKRLMSRYATREREVDRLLRGGIFVDLYAVTRQAVRAGIEGYSLKDLEALHGFVRALDLRQASAALRSVERFLELGDGATLDDEVRRAVETYNRDDCLSTWRLRNWLEARRREAILAGRVMSRPPPQSGEAAPKISERDEATAAAAARLLEGVPEAAPERTPEQQGRWLLAHLLEFYRRESNADWWEFFRLRDLPETDLLDDKQGLFGLELVDTVGGTARCPVHRYRYPAQEHGIRPRADLHANVAGQLGAAFGRVEAVDPTARTLDVKKRQAAAAVHPRAVFAHSFFSPQGKAKSLLRLAAWVLEHGFDAEGPHRAAIDLLLRRPPRVSGGWSANGDGSAEAVRIAPLLEDTTFPIQGPPGAGKTYTGARMIRDLVRRGRRVGVAAIGHKVIRNLLEAVVAACADEGLPVRCIHKVHETDGDAATGAIRELSDAGAVVRALGAGEVDVAGGTPFFWAGEEQQGCVDVLVVDEAGQMALADVLAAAPAARSIVLLGDPQQLEQPQQAKHPEGVGASSLEHLLGGSKTLPAERGIFLAETWRLAPPLCRFTSECFYDGRLAPHPGLDDQAILAPSRFAGAGLWLCPVDHEGNQTDSPEEVEAVARLCAELTTEGTRWRGPGGERPLTLEDVLVVAPYNAQVRAVGDRLPGCRVGTVDRFQGQEAAVVVVSLATSTPEDAPHGMEFLYSLYRLNVATSRARCAVILVLSPRLLEPACRTPRQIQLANAFCRYAELATAVRA